MKQARLDNIKEKDIQRFIDFIKSHIFTLPEESFDRNHIEIQKALSEYHDITSIQVLGVDGFEDVVKYEWENKLGEERKFSRLQWQFVFGGLEKLSQSDNGENISESNNEKNEDSNVNSEDTSTEQGSEELEEDSNITLWSYSYLPLIFNWFKKSLLSFLGKILTFGPWKKIIVTWEGFMDSLKRQVSIILKKMGFLAKLLQIYRSIVSHKIFHFALKSAVTIIALVVVMGIVFGILPTSVLRTPKNFVKVFFNRVKNLLIEEENSISIFIDDEYE